MFRSLVLKRRREVFLEVAIVQCDHYLDCKLQDSLLQKLQLKVMLIGVAPKLQVGWSVDTAFLV